MAQFVVRDLEEEVKTRLKRRAKRHGRSMEEGGPAYFFGTPPRIQVGRLPSSDRELRAALATQVSRPIYPSFAANSLGQLISNRDRHRHQRSLGFNAPDARSVGYRVAGSPGRRVHLDHQYYAV